MTTEPEIAVGQVWIAPISASVYGGPDRPAGRTVQVVEITDVHVKFHDGSGFGGGRSDFATAMREWGYELTGETHL